MTSTFLAQTLRTSARYARLYRDARFLVKLGGDVLADRAALASVAEQLAILSAFGIRPVLVHGAGPQLDSLCRRLGLEVRKIAGRRVTEPDVLEAAKCSFGAAQVDLLAALRVAGLSAVGLSGVDAGLITAQRRPAADGVVYGAVGDVEAVDTSVLEELVGAGRLPVVAPLIASRTGEIYNTNADTLAAALAVALGARRLFFLMRVPGLLENPADPSTLLPAADLAGLAALGREGKLSGGMEPKAAAIRLALAGGVEAIHLVSGFHPDALLTEVFTNEGSGTMVTAEPTVTVEAPA